MEYEISRELEKKRECPPGMRLVPEEEQMSMLSQLQASKAEVLQQLARMPIAMKTMSMQRRMDELEEKLRSIEKNIDLFSRKKVFIAM